MQNNISFDINEALSNPMFYFALIIILIVAIIIYYLFLENKNPHKEILHDHKNCPNYETCQQIKNDLKELATFEALDRTKKEIKDDISRDMNNFRELILEKFIAINDKIQNIKEDNLEMKSWIKELIERK